MQDYYRINVSLNGKYLFATEQGGICTPWDYEKVIKIMQDKFPKSEGYNVTCTHWKSRGEHIL